MLKIKQLNCARGRIDKPFNEFVKTLPLKGTEIVNIRYIPDHGGKVQTAIVEYTAEEQSEDPIQEHESEWPPQIAFGDFGPVHPALCDISKIG